MISNGGGQSMIYRSEEALRVFWKVLVTSEIPMVRWYLVAMVITSRSVDAARTEEEGW